MTQQTMAHRSPSNQQERCHGDRPNCRPKPDSLNPGNVSYLHGFSLPIRRTSSTTRSRNLCLIPELVNKASQPNCGLEETPAAPFLEAVL
jgi:hypothetical protein